MELRKLNVRPRFEVGSRAVMKLREAGFIPAVLYGAGKEASKLSIDAHHYSVVTKGALQTQVYEIESEDTEINETITLIKDVQVDPLADKILHVDLLEITRGQKLSVTVTVVVVGECEPVKQNVAMLNQSVYELEVECLPRAIPEVLEVDISNLKEGEGLHASDIELPSGVQLKSDPTLSIVSVVSQKEELEASSEEELESATSESAGADTGPAQKEKQ